LRRGPPDKKEKAECEYEKVLGETTLGVKTSDALKEKDHTP